MGMRYFICLSVVLASIVGFVIVDDPPGNIEAISATVIRAGKGGTTYTMRGTFRISTPIEAFSLVRVDGDTRDRTAYLSDLGTCKDGQRSTVKARIGMITHRLERIVFVDCY